MRTETTRIFVDLLSLHGHPAEPVPTPQPHQEGASMNLFKSLWLLGGLQSIDLRVGDEDERPFDRTYGNDVASRRLFGNPREEKGDAHGVETLFQHGHWGFNVDAACCENISAAALRRHTSISMLRHGDARARDDKSHGR